jgi:hypothetical protein
MHVPQWHAAVGRKKHCMEHKLLEFFDPVVSHGFKSIVACVLVGEVGLNFSAVLDEASFWINARRVTTSTSLFAIKCETRH